jgi:uncharacterized phage protein (TIGR02218 family)
VNFIDSMLGTIAFCWRVERRDGVCLGFTTHDRDLSIADLRYRAMPGMLPSAITLSDGFELDTLQVSGALTSEAINRIDLSAGRWDGAAVSIFAIDWKNPDGDQILLARGEFGDVSIERNGFTTELRGPAARLNSPVVEQTSPECRATLGDKRCRVAMASRIATTEIVAVETEDVVHIAEGAAGNAYGYGRLRWISGANSGLESSVRASEGTRLMLREPPRFPPAVGDMVETVEGCDKSFATCTARFANAANFRGEPHLPGMDLLTRYPGAQ